MPTLAIKNAAPQKDFEPISQMPIDVRNAAMNQSSGE
jgi:hypothetical protein